MRARFPASLAGTLAALVLGVAAPAAPLKPGSAPAGTAAASPHEKTLRYAFLVAQGLTVVVLPEMTARDGAAARQHLLPALEDTTRRRE